MTEIREFFESIFSRLNPGEVDFNVAGDVAVFIGLWVLLFVIILGIFFSIKNYRKIFDFLNQVYLELKKVTWLDRNSTYKYTVITLFAIIFGALFILFVDQAFLSLRNLVILRGN